MVNSVRTLNTTGLHILHRSIAGDAFHDSAERFPQPRCHPETRTKLLEDLRNWAFGDEYYFSEDDENSESSPADRRSAVLWLHGPAGSGKSAVAQSFCQMLQEERRLGGSFFFKRGHPSRGNAQKLFPTIAYQLALRLPELNQFILQTIEEDPAVVDRSLPHQLKNLIIEPCRKSSLSQTLAIIIDGLDECQDQNIQQELLRTIGDLIHRSRIPILFFIASRPESHIREAFADPGLDRFHRPLNIEQSFQDVSKYLQDEFTRIHREHRTMGALPSPWPPADIVGKLVEKSSEYFIYASTVVKFIDDKRFRPVERLNIVLGIKNSISGSPFDTLDQLYHEILSAVPVDFRAQLLQILAVIAARVIQSTVGIERLLELESGDVHLFLRDLHSVIKITEDQINGCFLSVHHASFLDFLDDASRSGPFCVGSSPCRNIVTRHILRAYSYEDDSSFAAPPLAKLKIW